MVLDECEYLVHPPLVQGNQLGQDRDLTRIRVAARATVRVAAGAILLGL